MTSPDGLAIALADALNDDGGGTFDRRDGSAPRHGYVVGRPGLGIVLESSERNVYGTIADWLRHLDDSVQYVGIWQDTATGLTYVDAVDILSDRQWAARRTRDRGELAFYSLHEGREYRVPKLT